MYISWIHQLKCRNWCKSIAGTNEWAGYENITINGIETQNSLMLIHKLVRVRRSD